MGFGISPCPEMSQLSFSGYCLIHTLPSLMYMCSFEAVCNGFFTPMLQYIRLADNTRPELTLELLIRQWKLKKPDIVISIHGGLKNFQLDPHHKEIFNRGLIKAAKTTNSGAWIITGKTCFLKLGNF